MYLGMMLNCKEFGMGYEDNKAYCDAIETLNSEYKALLSSPVIERNRKAKKIISLLAHFRFDKIVKMLKLRSKMARIDAVYREQSNGSTDYLRQYYENTSFRNSRIAVCYCIIGNYDDFQVPIFYPHNLDYYLFTDKPFSANGIKVMDIPEKLKGLPPTNINRYIKMHPGEFFPGYDHAIYLDGNVRVISDIRQWIVPAADSPAGIAMHLHPSRDCIYEEAEVCIQIGKGNPAGIAEQVKKYRSLGMPAHFGLFEATAIVVDLKSHKAMELLDLWYEEFSRSGSGRDQLSLPFVLWKIGSSIDSIGVLGNNIKDSRLLRVETKHNRF